MFGVAPKIFSSEKNDVNYIKSDFTHYQFNITNELEKALLNLPNNLTTGNEALETIQDIFSIIKDQ